MAYLKYEKKEDSHQNQKNDNKSFGFFDNPDWLKKFLSWVIRIAFIGGILFMLIWPSFPKYNSIKPLHAGIKKDNDGYYLDINLAKGVNQKIYYADENENLNYDCFAYYFQNDQQKTTYSFHGKPQGAKEIEFKIVVEPNNKNPNEKIFLIGSKTIEKDKDFTKAYSLFEKWITYAITNADHLPSPAPSILYVILHTLPSILLVYFLFSSMKIIAGAAFFAFANKSRTRFAPTPTNISSKLEPETWKKGTFASPATALANNVLPVPGGPYNNTPFGVRAPIATYFSGFFK